MKICFMGLTGYQLLNGNNASHVVGPDVYQILLARELLKHGFQISYINYDEGGDKTECIDGIEVIKIYPVKNNLNIFQKARAIAQAMKQADADIYFQQGGAGPITPLLCRLTGKKFIMSIGHDAYVDPVLRKTSGFRFNLKTYLEIKMAHTILVLSRSQQNMLKKYFGRDSDITRIHITLPSTDIPIKTQPPLVLWVGTIYPRKQPELFLELAKVVPQATFQMIGGSLDREYYKTIEEKAKIISNLQFIGYVPYDRINDYFSRASLFVSTSTSEGFPNVFIQSWMNYTPVVSLNIDPDDVIKKNGLGFHSMNFEQMVSDIKKLLENDGLRKYYGINCRQYAEENHNIKKVVEKHIEVFNRLSVNR
ncbi:MAG: glycosyltransferase family 4 protein [Dehalococcoidales bacterium]|nr:glycosyltransferase family 4 protein [Dehalococcoidales bacterium]